MKTMPEPIKPPQRLDRPAYSYSEVEAGRAYRQWGCNCGPSALAAMLSLKPDDVLPHLPKFRERGYTNPSMMKDALASLGVPWRVRRDVPADDKHTLTVYGLCRLQFEGPWTAPGVNPKWAYWHTHWVGAMTWGNNRTFVFDFNSGWTSQAVWEATTMVQLALQTKRANGLWHCTHRWELWPAS